RRIETNTELPDQSGAVGLAVLARLQAFEERAGAGAGDGTEIVDQLLAVHANAGIGNSQRRVFLVRRDADLWRRIANQVGVRNRLVTQLVAGVGGIGDQLAQKDVGLRIDGVNHQAQQLG